MKYLLIALQFLTIFPVRIKEEIEGRDFGKALIFFPVVGLIMGIVLNILVSIFNFLPMMVLTAIVLAVSVLVSGAIHLDGFADTCDGLYGAKPKERALEIMRDSSIGAMGVVGLILLFLLKASALSSLPKESLGKILIAGMVFSRYAQVFACFLSKYARKEGKARNFVEYAGYREFFYATMACLIILSVLLKIKGLFLFNLGLSFTLLAVIWIKRRIGGMTGDTIGAVSEIAEASVFLFALILI